MSLFKRKKRQTTERPFEQVAPSCPVCFTVGNLLQEAAFAGSNTYTFVCDTPGCETSHYTCDNLTGDVVAHIPDSAPSYSPSSWDSTPSYSDSGSSSSSDSSSSGDGCD